MENILLRIMLIISVIVIIVFLISLIWTIIVEPIIDFIKERKKIKNEELKLELKKIINVEKKPKEIEKNQLSELIREVERLGRIINHLTKDKEILVYEKKFGCVSNECVSNEKEKDVLCSPENYYRVEELKSGIGFVLDEKLNLKTPVTRIDLVEKVKKMILKEENK